jgi:hypothetical protein
VLGSKVSDSLSVRPWYASSGPQTADDEAYHPHWPAGIARRFKHVQRAHYVYQAACYRIDLAEWHQHGSQVNHMRDSFLAHERLQALAILNPPGNLPQLGRAGILRNEVQARGVRGEVVAEHVDRAVEQRFDYPGADTTLRAGHQKSHSSPS